jgi:hypothetical protein
MEGDAKTKGVSFVNARSFVTERHGASGWAAVIARLRESDRIEVESAVLVGWYSLPLYARLLRAIDETHGCGDCALLVQLGRFEAERDISTIHRIFLRMPNAGFAVERMGEYWRRFHDTGTWKIERATPAQVDVVLEGWGHVDRGLCRELGGYAGRVLELVGAKNVMMEHTFCRAHGDPMCAFRARWGSIVLFDGADREKSGPRRLPVSDAPPAPAPTSRSARR